MPLLSKLRIVLRTAHRACLLFGLLLLPGQAALANPPVPSALPAQFALGIQTNLGTAAEMASLGFGWRYAYLTGGLGSADWSRWQANGDYARLWLQDTLAAGLMPVFTFYQAVPASPHAGVEPPFGNLTTPATMRRYFDNWVLMLKICAEQGKPVVVHLEPDLFGYFQQTGKAPQHIPVSVGGSGHADAKGYADTASGYAQALSAMRDKYAPQVLIAWQASQWASGSDLISNAADPTATASSIASFFASFGAAYELIFSEFSDRDSGYYQTRGENRWWRAQDFDTFRRFLAQLSSQSGKRIVLWQIPMGNTLYRSLNNTNHHYQDNRAEYFLESVLNSGNRQRLQAYAEAGVLALLFGSGTTSQTMFTDAANDGSTSPAAINNAATNLSGRNNDLMPHSADDDGGFLRAAVGAYKALPGLPHPATVKADHDRVFDWAEQRLPGLFSPTAPSQVLNGFWLRHYPFNNLYLGHQNNRLYGYGEWFGGLVDLGDLSLWLARAQADGY